MQAIMKHLFKSLYVSSHLSAFVMLMLVGAGQVMAESAYYQLYAYASPSEGGTVYASINATSDDDQFKTLYKSETYSADEGSVATVYYFAKPNDGYRFIGWKNMNGITVSRSASASFSVEKVSGTEYTPTQISYTAVFGKETTQIKEKTLAEISGFVSGGGNWLDSNVGSTFKVAGNNLQCVYRFIAHNGEHYLVVRDGDQSANYYCDAQSSDYSEAKNMLKDESGNEIDQRDYTQNNWLLVEVSEAVYNEYDGCENTSYSLESVTGTLTDAKNPTIDATEVVKGSATGSPALLNTYTPINFLMYNDNPLLYAWKGDDYDVMGSWFFMCPKRCELAKVTWLVYNEDGNFYLPDNVQQNPYQIKAGVEVAWDLNVWETPTLTPGGKYAVTAIVMDKEEYHTGTNTSRRKASSLDGMDELSILYEIYPLDVKKESEIVTWVADVQAQRQVKSVRYYDIAGRMSQQPFGGVNVVLTTYTDGTCSASKVIK